MSGEEANHRYATVWPGTMGIEHARQLFAPLTELSSGWRFWWVGSGSAAQLVGLHEHARGNDLLYVSSEEQASVTRTRPDGQIYLHESDRPLSTVVGYLSDTHDRLQRDR